MSSEDSEALEIVDSNTPSQSLYLILLLVLTLTVLYVTAMQFYSSKQ